MNTLVSVRAGQARILAWRGHAEQAAASLDRLESASRGTGSPQYVVMGLASSCFARARIGQTERAGALIAEIAAIPDLRQTQSYALVPELVRTAVAVGEIELAGRVAASIEPLYPYAEHARVAAYAALAEAGGRTPGRGQGLWRSSGALGSIRGCS